jgi:hypothetical protein
MSTHVARAAPASICSMSIFKECLVDTDTDTDETDEQKFDRIEGLVFRYMCDALEYSRTVIAGDDPEIDADVVYYVRRECFNAYGEFVRPCRTRLRGIAVAVRKKGGKAPFRTPTNEGGRSPPFEPL